MSTSNSVIKKEFVISRNFVVPVIPNIAAVQEPREGSIAYNLATQGLVVSNGVSWSSPAAPSATPTLRGIIFARTSETPGTTTSLGNTTGNATGGNVFVGWRAGFNNNGAQTGLTFVGHLCGAGSQNVSNKTVMGTGSGIQVNSNQNSTGVGTGCLNGDSGDNNSAAGYSAQLNLIGSGNSSIGATSLGITGNPQFDNSVAIGYGTLVSSVVSSGIVCIGSTTPGLNWVPGSSTDVVLLGNSSSLSSNITNVIAIGTLNFTGAVANNTLVVTNDVTQWRSLGLSVSASANILQFDPVTGLITQAASSQRFKQNIKEAKKEESSDILDVEVCTYEINGKIDHGIISENVPEKYATFDSQGQRNGVKLLRVIMSILAEIQVLRQEILESQE
ncbi:hypothetical protein ISTM_413 [Insectomime virus]|uniref:Peptidase S74 domain-containing protein n=1 Tax=Tunisvirus fontaine2 TaxID=1421067 RepID=V9SFL2_9VIRU|nr:hypothetical protein D1R32_gp389 [Tunisvirus fontaine2]AHA46311.1 hypothetical protein ISTM_413 [Insectomime virus]AHC55106.1 hypothetical protein TNS_ORF388 [Tunisvirus fontaine2]